MSIEDNVAGRKAANEAYLTWFDGDVFMNDLRRYLRREDVQREQEMEARVSFWQ